jgi:hypothetical protein
MRSKTLTSRDSSVITATCLDTFIECSFSCGKLRHTAGHTPGGGSGGYGIVTEVGKAGYESIYVQVITALCFNTFIECSFSCGKLGSAAGKTPGWGQRG